MIQLDLLNPGRHENHCCCVTRGCQLSSCLVSHFVSCSASRGGDAQDDPLQILREIAMMMKMATMMVVTIAGMFVSFEKQRSARALSQKASAESKML